MNERKDKLARNSERSLDEPGRDPREVRQVAEGLLNQVAYAATLTNTATARGLATLQSDVDLHIDDMAAGEAMHAHAAVQSLPAKLSILSPIIKAVSKRRNGAVRNSYERRGQEASRRRLQYVQRLHAEGHYYMTWRTTEVSWPRRSKADLVPLDLHIGAGDPVLALNPYQIQACGVIEVVRAAGAVLGSCNGDWLADQYMRMILALAGIGGRGGDREWGREMVAGGFAEMAATPQDNLEEWDGLPGRSQLLAITVLAAWLRMGRLGVDMFRIEHLEEWQTFFDGTLYGSEDYAGEIWKISPAGVAPYERSEFWLGSTRHPWEVEAGGSPVVPIGIAGETLRLAIAEVEEIGLVPDDFDPEDDCDRDFDRSSKILLQLRRHYREIAGVPVGAAVSAILTDKETRKGSNQREKGSPASYRHPSGA